MMTLLVRWYSKCLGRVEAEKILTNADIGTFLVRNSEKTAGCYVLSVKNCVKEYICPPFLDQQRRRREWILHFHREV